MAEIRNDRESTSGPRALSLLALGMILGVAIWLLSARITGSAEPWDADAPFWLYSWVLMAVLGGLSGRIRGACLPLGFALGQMLITIQSVFVGEFGALGWMFIGAYAAAATIVTLTLAGAVAAFKGLRRRLGSDGEA